MDAMDGDLVLELKHTGERLQLRRVREPGGALKLIIKASLPPHRQGPPLHVHFVEDERGRVISGTLSASVGGETVTIEADGEATFPRGSAHRWWNDGDETLVFEGEAKPVVDLDRYLQAVFEVVNAGPPDRPPLFYMAHVLHRHRRTQAALLIPRWVQALFFPVIIAAGNLLGKYKGVDWPGCPARCTGAPTVHGAQV